MKTYYYIETRNPLFIGSCSDIVNSQTFVLTKISGLAIPSLSGHAVIFPSGWPSRDASRGPRNPLFIGSCSDMLLARS